MALHFPVPRSIAGLGLLGSFFAYHRLFNRLHPLAHTATPIYRLVYMILSSDTGVSDTLYARHRSVQPPPC